MSSQEAPAAD